MVECIETEVFDLPLNINFYPGNDQSIAVARSKAIETIWMVATNSLEMDFALAEEARLQHFEAIRQRCLGNYADAEINFDLAESNARENLDIRLLCEILAHKVDMHIIKANTSNDLMKGLHRKYAMANAIEAFTYADYLGRDDIAWFGWKVFEAACETYDWKYASQYWLMTTGLELPIVKSFPKTLDYGIGKVKRLFKLKSDV